MCCTKGIHYVTVSIACQSLGELLLTDLHGLLSLFVSGIGLLNSYRLAFLFGIVTEILKQECFTHLQGCSSFLSFSTVGSKCNRTADSLLHSTTNLAERKFGVHLAFGLTHMAHDDGGTTIGNNLLQCGKGTTDTGVVGNLTILVQGHVEVHAHDCLFAGKLVIINSHLDLRFNYLRFLFIFGRKDTKKSLKFKV